MTKIPTFLKDPLIHFLIIGGIFFLAVHPEPPAEPAAAQLVVDRDALLEFIQFRSKAFDQEAAEALLDSMNEERRQQLIKDYIEEEVLYREAKALGLEADDYIIKQRLIEKLGFLTETSVGEIALSDDDVAAYYEANKEDYFVQPSATFAHVFYSTEKRSKDAAENLATRMTRRLNRTKGRFEDAVKHGDRFPFYTNYVDRTFDYVASQFGDEAARIIFDENGPFNAWRGPVFSEHGAHVIVVKKVTPGRTPALTEIRDQISEDATRSRKQEMVSALIAETIERYDVVVDLPAPTEAIAATSPKTSSAP